MPRIIGPQTAVEIGSRPESVKKYKSRRLLLQRFLLPRYQLEIHGQEHLQTAGPLVIFAAHQSNLDPPLLAALSDRHL